MADLTIEGVLRALDDQTGVPHDQIATVTAALGDVFGEGAIEAHAPAELANERGLVVIARGRLHFLRYMERLEIHFLGELRGGKLIETTYGLPGSRQVTIRYLHELGAISLAPPDWMLPDLVPLRALLRAWAGTG